MADQEEVVTAVTKRAGQARITHSGEVLITDREAEFLVRAATYGTPGGFTDAEGEAFLSWATTIRAKCAILETILAGAVVPDIKGMTDADSNTMLYLPGKAAARRAEHEEGQDE